VLKELTTSDGVGRQQISVLIFTLRGFIMQSIIMDPGDSPRVIN